MRAQVTGDNAGKQIVSAARRRADDEADLLAAIKARHVFGRLGLHGGNERKKQRDEKPSHACTLRALSLARNVSNSRPGQLRRSVTPRSDNASQITA